MRVTMNLEPEEDKVITSHACRKVFTASSSD